MKCKLLTTLFIAAGLLSSSVYAAVDVKAGSVSSGIEAKLPEKKRDMLHHYLSPKEVYDIKKAEGNKVLFVDIRTPYELQFVGHTPMIDGNVPYITFDYSDWDDKKKTYKRQFNSGFVGQVEDLMKKTGINYGKDTKIILMCRSGDRSAKATDLMAKNGYTNVWSAWQGFEGDKVKSGEGKGKRVVNGWKNAGLPWTYKMDKEKAAFVF